MFSDILKTFLNSGTVFLCIVLVTIKYSKFHHAMMCVHMQVCDSLYLLHYTMVIQRA